MAIGGPDLRTAPALQAAPLPKLVARMPDPAAAPGAPLMAVKPTARVIVPGAIAALSQPRTDQQRIEKALPDKSAGSTPLALGLPDAPSDAIPAGIVAPPIRVETKPDRGVRDARADRSDRDEQDARRDRQRQAARRSLPPEPFKYPSYLGASPPKYNASQAPSSGKSNFACGKYERYGSI